METYMKNHTSRKAALAHAEKIKARSGHTTLFSEDGKYYLAYFFKPKKKAAAKKKKQKKYDVLNPDGKSIRIRDVAPFTTKKAALEYFEKWREKQHRHGYWSPSKGLIIANNLKRYCKIIELKK